LATAEDGPIRCAEVAALSVDEVAAVQQQVRARAALVRPPRHP
jgi:hypothetical protein